MSTRLGDPEVDLDLLAARCDELHAEGIELIRFVTYDMFGRCRGKAVEITSAKDKMTRGVGIIAAAVAQGPKFELTPCPSVETNSLPNHWLKPADQTIHVIPWAKGPVAEVICEPYWGDGALVVASPRYILRKQLKLLRELGYEFFSAFENEFFVFDQATMTPASANAELCHVPVMAQFEDLLCEITSGLRKVDIQVETAEIEGSPGQFEFTFQPGWGIKTADDNMRFRGAAKAVFQKRGLAATFMSCPVDGHDEYGNANSYHFNHSLWDLQRERNVFCGTEDGPSYDLSDVGRYWMGGLIKHADALTAMCCSTVNCYRRIHIPFYPNYHDWGFDNRLATFRVVGERGGRVESRLPSGSANPYLATAATIIAGMDGIKNRLEPPPPGPNASAPELPHTLQDALQALQRDEAMCSGLGHEFVEWYLVVKSHELEALKDHNIKQRKTEEIVKEREYFFNL